MAHSKKKLAVSLVALLATLALFAALSAAAQGVPGPDPAIINPAIDEDAYLRVVGDALGHRARQRLSESDFIRMSREPGTIILDARSAARFDELHVEGAINLSFPDIAVASLAEALPDKTARILIYCNNNFSGAEGAFPSKLPSASLNLPTYVALYDYGYRNVYELGPLIDVAATAIVFAGSAAPER
ncbi:MAG TPA: rhodanese-like domain-containing protein [Caldimonas sp.]|nr:rhodanese-like domain-containing protein [Caldimonas sp.]